MDAEQDFNSESTSSDILIQMLTDEEDGEEATKAFLKSEFLVSAVDALFSARREAGLTQAQVADRLNTKQASIARLEADTTGSITLRRYVEVALACGMVPLNITLVPISSARQYVIENAEEPITADAYALWHRSKNLQPSPASLNFKWPKEARCNTK